MSAGRGAQCRPAESSPRARGQACVAQLHPLPECVRLRGWRTRCRRRRRPPAGAHAARTRRLRPRERELRRCVPAVSAARRRTWRLRMRSSLTRHACAAAPCCEAARWRAASFAIGFAARRQLYFHAGALRVAGGGHQHRPAAHGALGLVYGAAQPACRRLGVHVLHPNALALSSGRAGRLLLARAGAGGAHANGGRRERGCCRGGR